MEAPDYQEGAHLKSLDQGVLSTILREKAWQELKIIQEAITEAFLKRMANLLNCPVDGVNGFVGEEHQ